MSSSSGIHSARCCKRPPPRVLERYDFFAAQVAACEAQILAALKTLSPPEAPDDGDRGCAAKPPGKSQKHLKDAVHALRALFHGLDLAEIGDPHTALCVLPNAMDHILKLDPGDDPDHNRGVRQFMDLATKASKAQALGGTQEAALSMREEVGFYQAVRAGLIKHTRSGRKMSKAGPEAAMRHIVAQDVLVEGATDLYCTLGVDEPDMSVSNEHFLAQIAKLATKNLAAELLQRIIDDEIRSRSRRNTTQGYKFSEKLTEAINRHRNRGLTTDAVIEELIRLAKEIGEDRPPEDMSEDEYAFYEAVRENEPAVRKMGEKMLISLGVELTHKLRASAIFDWQRRKRVRAQMQLLVKMRAQPLQVPAAQAARRGEQGDRAGRALCGSVGDRAPLTDGAQP